MNIKKLCLFGIVLIGQSVAADAQKKNFSITEATLGMGTSLALQAVKAPSWQPGTHHFYQVVKANGTEYLVRTRLPQGNTDTVESLQNLNAGLAPNSKIKSFPQLNWLDHDYAYFQNGNDIDRGALTGNGFHWSHYIALPEGAENIHVDKTMQIAYTIKNNLWLVTKDKRMVQVTNEANKNIISGQSVHRNEFGIDGGIFFSPQGNYLAYYQMDQTMVNDYPIVKWNDVPAVADMIKYPMAGGTSHQVTLRVYNPKTQQTTILETGEPKDHYLTAVSWSPDEKYIFIGILNRGQDHLWLNKYNAATGKKMATLFEETSDSYVEPTHPLVFLPNSNNEFIWQSEEDGYDHLYLYNTHGGLIRKLTPGSYDVNELIGFNEHEQEVIITSAKESPLEKHAYAVNWNSGAMRRIDKEAGTHAISQSEDGAYVFDVYSATGAPKVSLLRSAQNNYTKVLIDAPNTLSDYDRPTINNVTLKADDSTPLYGKIMLPPNFSPSKKYPVIVYLYNGPHVQLVKNAFPESGNLWYEYMAQRGYIVFTMDGRGSDNRGAAFERATFRRLGTIEMNDQLKGVEYLKSLPYVDAKRMGVHGWSFGGFMTTSLMLRHPGVFKVGVCGGPVIDWKMYEIMYTERYMDTPEQNPKGYEDANLLTKVKNLKGKLLMIHGTDDDVVVWQNSIKFVKKCVDEGVQLDYFVYPGHPHNVRGKDRVHLMQKITDYFDEYLK